MKSYKIYGLLLLLVSLFGCSKSEPEHDSLKGYLSVNLGLYIDVNNVNGQLKAVEDIEAFNISVYNSTGTQILNFENASEMPDEIELEVGQYYITAHSENDLPAEFDNPYYFGQSDLFSISANSLQTVVVNCELANTIVTISYSDNIKNSCTDYFTTVSSIAGFLNITKEETRKAYFRTLPLTLRAELIWQKANGTLETKILTGTISNPLPNKHYEINVDANFNEGMALIQINLDESTLTTETVDLSENTNTLNINDLNYGDLLIAEIMYNPSALSDTEGEWFEIYNYTNSTINIRNLVITENTTNIHIVSNDILVQPSSYYVLARSENAFAGDKYVYGSINLVNTGAVLSLKTFGVNGTDGNEIFTINYGGEGFPAGTGASLCLDPGSLNPVNAVSGNNWCISGSLFNTGDLGTPAARNDYCQN